MKYQLKQKMWSPGSDFVIKDEHEQPVYIVDGEAFSWGDKLSFQDMQGTELAYISQKLLTLKPKYEIFRDGELFAEVIQEFSWFKKKFTLDVPGPNDYEIDGSFWDHEYTFRRSGGTVATVSKKLWSWSDIYGVEIAEDEDDVAILSTVVVIDLICNDGN